MLVKHAKWTGIGNMVHSMTTIFLKGSYSIETSLIMVPKPLIFTCMFLFSSQGCYSSAKHFLISSILHDEGFISLSGNSILVFYIYLKVSVQLFIEFISKAMLALLGCGSFLFTNTFS